MTFADVIQVAINVVIGGAIIWAYAYVLRLGIRVMRSGMDVGGYRAARGRARAATARSAVAAVPSHCEDDPPLWPRYRYTGWSEPCDESKMIVDQYRTPDDC